MKFGAILLFLLFSVTAFMQCTPESDLEYPTVHADGLHQGVTAHRGNSGNLPENTMAAFESAVELNVDWVELDVFVTKDGKLVVIHDPTTGRMGDRDLEVAQSTYDELLEVDVSVDFLNRKGEAFEGELPENTKYIPLLEEVLQFFNTVEGTRLSIQPKTDSVDAAVELIRQFGLEGSTGFNDGNLEYMKRVKELAPEIHVFWDRPGNLNLEKDIEIALEHGFEGMVINHSGISEDVVKKVTEAGLEIGTWTVNDPDVMRRFLDLGVQRIYTDYRDVLIDIKSERQGE